MNNLESTNKPKVILSLEQVLKEAKTQFSWQQAIRRDFHQYPELGYSEFRTADKIEGYLKELGIEYSRDQTAIVAIVRGTSPGVTLGFRADIDALPIQEETGLEFASKNAQKMHACGHDAHTAILLGTARWFANHRDFIKGNVKFFFQPAEETDGGAEIMVQKGCLENPKVDWVFGQHVMPNLPVGIIETKRGTLNGNSTALEITITGKSGHGAYPESGVDAILAAAQVITALHTLVSRRVSPLESAVLSLGVIQGGRASNIIADKVTISGTLRSATDGLRDQLLKIIEQTITSVAQGLGAQGQLKYSFGYAAVVNHDNGVDLVAKVTGKLLGTQALVWKEKPSMGVEDFSYFILDTPGAFYHLGCGHSDQENFPLHSSCFNLNEECMPLGTAMQVGLALEAMGILGD